jgi:acetyl esterase/lipase
MNLITEIAHHLPLTILSLLVLALLFTTQVNAVDEPKTLLLWADGAPETKGDKPQDKPEIIVYLPAPEKATGAAVVICPGGGYGGLMMSYEGRDIAKWLNGMGIAGIVLKYRVMPYRHPCPMLDGQRAMRIVRKNAKAWGIKPDHIGIMGFSAGGHVASTVGTHFDAGNAKANDPIEQVSSRPDFMILIYPVITMGEKGHAGSRNTLLGPNPTQAEIDFVSNEKQVTADTPPAFLAHSKKDSAVSVANSQMFYDALIKNKVKATFLELSTGEHGLGCGNGPEWKAWQDACAEWLKADIIKN